MRTLSGINKSSEYGLVDALRVSHTVAPIVATTSFPTDPEVCRTRIYKELKVLRRVAYLHSGHVYNDFQTSNQIIVKPSMGIPTTEVICPAE